MPSLTGPSARPFSLPVAAGHLETVAGTGTVTPLLTAGELPPPRLKAVTTHVKVRASSLLDTS